MSVRALLRAATAGEHGRVDALFSRFDLTRCDEYGRFLLAQAAAFVPIEALLDAAGAADVVADWPQRRRAALLAADLAALGLAAPPAMNGLPELSSPSRILGAVYVLEGSRLGGAVLTRTVPGDFPNSFLGAGAPSGSWRKLLEMLDKNLYAAESIDAAIHSARKVFMIFQAAAEEHSRTRAA